MPKADRTLPEALRGAGTCRRGTREAGWLQAHKGVSIGRSSVRPHPRRSAPALRVNAMAEDGADRASHTSTNSGSIGDVPAARGSPHEFRPAVPSPGARRNSDDSPRRSGGTSAKRRVFPRAPRDSTRNHASAEAHPASLHSGENGRARSTKRSP